MELIYIWVKEYKCIHRQGFCLSPEFTVEESVNKEGEGKLIVRYTKKDNLFQNLPITNLTVLVGENGSGKTTFLEYVHHIHCYPVRFLDKSSPEEGENVTIIRQGNRLLIYTNMTSSKLEIEWDVAPLEVLPLDQNNETEMARTALLLPEYFDKVTKLYITNSYYSQMNGSFSHGGLDSLVFSPGALSAVAHELFQFICPENDSKEREDLFWQYSRFLRNQKRAGEFQQLCDVMFYWHLIEKEALKDYAGFVQTNLILRVTPVWEAFRDKEAHWKSETDQEYFQGIKRQFDQLERVYDKNKGKQSLIYVLQSNFIAEYSLVCEGLFEKYSFDSIEALFEALEGEMKRETDLFPIKEYRGYFEEAYKEIQDFRELVREWELCENQVPKEGENHKKGVKISADFSEKELKGTKYAQICKFFAERVNENQKIREGKRPFGSFLLRYIVIDNLLFSSGERAFQNLMSWMFFGAKLSKAAVTHAYVPHKEILLCVDEADLYCHPSWQRDFIDNLYSLITKTYEGYSIQIILTTHSPLCLSDVPRENIIYLKNEQGNTIVDKEEHRQTFGCSLYELLNDAFYLDKETMGKFAKRYINKLICQINTLQVWSEERETELRKMISHIGDAFIRRKLEQQLEWRLQWEWRKQLENMTPGERSLKLLEIKKERIEKQIEQLKGTQER